MKINRRLLLKSGLLSLTGIHGWSLSSGSSLPPMLDAAGRIYHSPLLREYFPDHLPDRRPLIQIGYNENPYGPSPATCEAIRKAVTDRAGNRYAGPELNELTGLIAQKEGVDKDFILIGPGLSDLLDRTALGFCAGQGNVVSADPTFMSLIQVARLGGAEWKPVPCKEDGNVDLAGVYKAIDSQTRLVYLCNPGNPIGTIISPDKLRDFCTEVSRKVPVFIDEAYLEFAGGATTSMVPLIKEGKNIIVGRTFSKVLGMAGLRTGYLIGQPATLRKIAHGGIGISVTTIRGGIAAMRDTDFQIMTLRKNVEVKGYLCKELDAMGMEYPASYTNFVLFPIRMPGKEFVNRMSEKGIFIRAFDIQNRPWCRVSMGTMDEIRQFVTVLKTLV